MFDLEQAIAEWRQQMLTAGIKSPVPLEELESHLREEIEQLMKSGLSEQQAFEVTVLQIGQGKELRTEFTKGQGWWDMLHDDMPRRVRFVLVLMVAYSVMIMGSEIFSHLPRTWLAEGLLLALLTILAITIYLAGIFWSIFLSHRTKPVRSTVYFISQFSVWTIGILSLLELHHPSTGRHLLQSWPGIVFYFNIFTGMLTALPLPAEPKKATK